jgi:Ni,Fe-hydrogenase III small subunit
MIPNGNRAPADGPGLVSGAKNGMTPTDGTGGIAGELRQRIARQFGRSLHIRTLDTGSCAVCEQEIRLLAAPHYDLHRLGFFFTPAPRHADLLLVTGPMIRAMDVAARKTYQAMPGPKVVVATGACALGGVYPEDPFVHGDIGKVLPVDVWIPGCPQPARPAARAARGRRPAGGTDARPDIRGRGNRHGRGHGPGRAAGRRRHPVTPLVLLYVAAGGWGLAAVTALAAGQRRPGMQACCVASGLGGAAAAAGGAWALVSGSTRLVTLGGPAAARSIVGGSLQLQLTSLAGVFVALLGVVAVAIACYAPRYHAPGRGTGLYLAAYNLALLACLAVLAAGGMVTFLVAWESMSLLCYLLILRHPGRRDVARGAFWFLALSETGFLLIVAAFVILAAKTHTTEIGAMAARASLIPGGWRDAAYLLALAGFGFKAGLVPLHVWLPRSAPGRPSGRLRLPVRRGGHDGHLRHRAVRVPAAARRGQLAGTGDDGSGRGHGHHRHPLRAA